MKLTLHQLKQKEVINQIEAQAKSKSLSFSTVALVSDYANDPQISLTGVHLPHKQLIEQIEQQLIKQLRVVEPDFYHYPQDSLHMTIKGVGVVPNSDQHDIKKAEAIFSDVSSRHHRFGVYFYRLILFPHSLALVGTSDPELDNIILDIDSMLTQQGIPDDKIYINSRYFFSNMTLVRFNREPSAEFVSTVDRLSKSIRFEPYTVDSITLLTCNAVLKRRNIIGTWNLL